MCSVKLKPFCLGHIILLEQLASPLISPEEHSVDEKGGLAHFFLALLICSLNYEDGCILLNDKNELESTINLFLTNLKTQMAENKDWNYLSKMKLFEEYMRYYLDMPFFTEQNTNTENIIPSGTDWKNSLFLIFKKMGYTETQILNMSMKKMYYLWTSYAEAEGAIKVMNKHEVEQLEQLNKKKV